MRVDRSPGATPIDDPAAADAADPESQAPKSAGATRAPATGGGRMDVAASLSMKEPPIPTGKDFKGVHYGPISGDLFVGGPKASDVGQGSIGDCFFLSSLASVARLHPDVVKNAIKDNGDGTYTVTFKNRAKDGTVTDVPVTVDAQVPLDKDGNEAFGRGLQKDASGHEELWPSIFEKAFATWKHGYDKINEGGYGDKALTALTGAPSTHTEVDKLTDDQLWDMIDKAAKAKQPMVCGSRPAKDLKKATGDKKMADFVEDHDYSILNTFVGKDGVKYVKVRNPWGDTPPKGVDGLLPRPDGGEKGIFDLSVSEFRKYFEDVMINQTDAPPPKP
jgi:hypothetical protein